jgi:hypothetical protein
VEFRLLYEGPLLSSGNRAALENKHQVRKVLHPQLRKLWWNHLGARQLAIRRGNTESKQVSSIDDRQQFDVGISAIAGEWTKCSFQFVPLVTPKSAVCCGLDILLLRPEGEQTVVGPNGPTFHRFIVNQGDIDGQLKTLMDALRFPDQPSEIRDFAPKQDETPMFCLLSDDKLISEIRIDAKPLLLLPNHKQATPTDCFAVIRVKVNPQYPGSIGNFLA